MTQTLKKKCKVYYSIYIKFKNRKNLSVVLEVRMAVCFWGVVVVRGECMGDSWGPGNVPFLYPGAGYMDVFTIQKLTEL